MVRILISILFFTGSWLGVVAQSGSMKVYTDQRTYIAGEKIWVAGLLISRSGEEDLVRAWLLDRNGAVVQQANVLSTGGKISFPIQLEGTIGTDYYLLALSSKGYPDVFIPLAIINPALPPKTLHPETVLQTSPGLSVSEAGNMNLTSDKQSYSRREEVKVGYTLDPEMEYQVSVAIQDELSKYIDSSLSAWEGHGLELLSSEEEEGHVFTLSLLNASNQPAAGVRVYASVPGDQANIATAVTDAQGKALIRLPFVYGSASVIFSAPGGQFRIVYEESPVQVKGAIELPYLSLGERFRASIEQRLLNTEIMNKFRPESKISYTAAGLDTTDFYGKPDKRYMLDDYTRIPNMEEILYEYVVEARARKNGDKSFIFAFNTPFKTFFELPALVLLDGVPVTDIDQLLAMDPLTLRSVDVVARKFLLNDLQISGIVHYKSYKADLAGFRLPSEDAVHAIQGLSIPVQPQFVTRDQAGLPPDMRNLLFWQPFSKQPRISFYTPDNDGEYLVTMRGIGKTGNEILQRVVLTVK